ncbi:MAG: nucleoside 2-deoxyribosyltransferase [Candidatus Woesearchaeota archaeon]
MVKIYFAASIRAGREDVDIYRSIIEYLKLYGEVLTEHIGNKNLSASGENLPERKIHDRDLEWLLKSEVVVAEGTVPSLGVGYELGRVAEKKPILCLYRPVEGKLFSGMIKGSSAIKTVKYTTLDEAKKVVDEFMREHGYIRQFKKPLFGSR